MTEKPPHRIDQLFDALKEGNNPDNNNASQNDVPDNIPAQRFTPAYWRKKSEKLSDREKAILARLTRILHIIITLLGLLITAGFLWLAIQGKTVAVWFMMMVFWLAAMTGVFALQALGMYIILGITIYMARN